MQWNVYYCDMNTNKIMLFNVFNHYSFRKEVKKLLTECSTIEEFSDKIRNSAMYYFWGKCEWEVIVKSLFARTEENSLKIDIYNQLLLNWDVFIKYVWSYKSS